MVVLAAWQLAWWQGMLPEYVLPPTQVVAGMVDGYTEGDFWSATAISLKRVLAGFIIGAGIGVLVGLVAGGMRLVDDVVDPLVALTYALPKIALFPVVAVWLGFSDPARVLIIAVSCFYPAYINTMSGTRDVDPHLLWVARNVGAHRVERFRSVVLRAATPQIFVGLRISLALALVVLFSVEVISAGGGLGGIIYQAYLGGNYERMYGSMLALALLGFIGDRIVVTVGRTVTKGQELELARHA